MLQNVLVWPNSIIRATLFIRLTIEERARETVKKKKVVYPLLWGLFEIKIQAKLIQTKKMLSIYICFSNLWVSSKWVEAYLCTKADVM